MIVYEVQLQVSKEVLEKYLDWLEPHIEKMLQFPGFVSARLLLSTENSDPDWQEISVQYQISTQNLLQEYLEKRARAMRAEAEEKFAGAFRASRKIWYLQRDLLSYCRTPENNIELCPCSS